MQLVGSDSLVVLRRSPASLSGVEHQSPDRLALPLALLSRRHHLICIRLWGVLYLRDLRRLWVSLRRAGSAVRMRVVVIVITATPRPRPGPPIVQRRIRVLIRGTFLRRGLIEVLGLVVDAADLGRLPPTSLIVHYILVPGDPRARPSHPATEM